MECGPFPGWIMGYVVRRGDTLYRIALRFRTSVADLEQANCKTSSRIYAGERLWVPSARAYPWQHPGVPQHDVPWGYHSQPGLPPASAIPYP